LLLCTALQIGLFLLSFIDLDLNLLAHLRGMSGAMGRNLSQRTLRTVRGDLVR
jgi:hypothetical protein